MFTTLDYLDPTLPRIDHHASQTYDAKVRYSRARRPRLSRKASEIKSPSEFQFHGDAESINTDHKLLTRARSVNSSRARARHRRRREADIDKSPARIAARVIVIRCRAIEPTSARPDSICRAYTSAHARVRVRVCLRYAVYQPDIQPRFSTLPFLYCVRVRYASVPEIDRDRVARICLYFAITRAPLGKIHVAAAPAQLQRIT